MALWFLILCLAPATLPSFADDRDPDRRPPWTKDVEALVEGVSEIAAPGALPGSVVAFGSEAFPVVLAGAGGVNRAPLAAAARWVSGRVVVIAHDAFVGRGAAQAADTRRFVENAIQWVAGGAVKPRLRVGVVGADLPEARQGRAFDLQRWDDAGWIARLGGIDVLVLCGVSPSADERAAIQKFVTGGGGLVAALCPWGWMQVTRASSLAESGLQALVSPAGLAFTEGTVETTGPKGYLVSGVPGMAFHAERAIDLLIASADKAAMGHSLVQASLVAQQAIGVLPPGEKRIRSRLDRLLRERSGRLVPTEREPLRADRPLDRFLLAAQVSALARATDKDVEPHPAAAAFPGLPPRDAKAGRHLVAVDLTVPGWHSTGLYAVPGKGVTATVTRVPGARAAEESASPAGLALRIGCHSDALWALASWPRVPGITLERPFVGLVGSATSAFGGLVYVVVPGGAKGQASVTIDGAVEAPLYVLGFTSKEEWAKSRRAPGPWAELGSTKVILSIPSDRIRDLVDPEPLMRFWDRVLDADADLAGLPHARLRPERYVADVEISAGYMHSGYPIMTHLDAAERMVDLELLSTKGDWGLFHEMGHNHQSPDWTFDGTTEVTCNLFALYVLQTVVGLHGIAGHEALADREKRAADHVRAGAPFSKWKSDPFLALAMYTQLIEGFGWDPFRRVFADERALPSGEHPATDDAKRDQWMIRFSRAVGKNLGPFFEAWGVPTAPAARASIASLPAWIPPGFPSR